MADDEQPALGAGEVPVAKPTESTPQCIDPTAKVNGLCGPGKIEIAAAASSEYKSAHRCISVPPDAAAGYPTDYIPDCSENDHDRCQPCIWKKPPCSVFGRLNWQKVGNYLNNQKIVTGLNDFVAVKKQDDNPYNACLASKINEADVNAKASLSKGVGTDPYYDDLFLSFLKVAFGITVQYTDPTTGAILTNPTDPKIKCTEFGDPHPYFHQTALPGGGVKLQGVNEPVDAQGVENIPNHFIGVCVSGSAFLDLKNCRVRPFSDVKTICGSAVVTTVNENFYPSSPISLLWSDDADIEKDAAIVQFPLDPRHPSHWYLWKASAKAPLLVYDPAHTGKVNSAAQLFGNWTFGGKQLASLTPSPAVTGEPWENGYEALATLDRNGDRRLTGEELAPLALWFDENQDAVVQPGEVRSLAAEGVTALSVDSDSEDALTGDLFASNGYQRTMNGRTLSGRSVDWFTKGSPSPSGLRSFFSENMPVVDLPAPQLASDSLGAITKPVTVDGAWRWRFENQRGKTARQNYQGVLYLRTAQDKGVVGVSLSESGIKSNDRILGSLLHFTLLTGSGQRTVDGTTELKFSTVTKESPAETTATLSADGERIDGVTTEYAGPNGKRLTYRWTAHRASR
jgi:hypothetical protein